MKKVIFTALSMTLAITSFTGCKDKGSTPRPNTYSVNVTGVTGETEGITDVKGLYFTEININTFRPNALITNESNVLASATYADNAFTLAFPLILTGDAFQSVTQEIFPEGVTLSAPFKTLFISFQAYKGTELAGAFYRASAEPNATASLIYSDAAATINGEGVIGGDEYAFNVTLTPGWHWIYIQTEDVAADEESDPVVPTHKKYTIQTTAFTGVTLAWTYAPQV